MAKLNSFWSTTVILSKVLTPTFYRSFWKIQQCRLKRVEETADENGFITSVQDKKAAPSFGQPKPATGEKQAEDTEAPAPIPDNITNFYDKIDNEEEEEEEMNLQTVSFEVNQEKIEVIQKRCIA